jgi:stage II sporulation protein D (peptidoglycan lytic transglycosylase)
VKRGFILTSLWLMACGLLPLRAQDFRVEWPSGRSIKTLRFEARSDSLRLCSSDKPIRCVAVPPGKSAECTLSAGFFHCTAAAATVRLNHFTAVSNSPFILAATFTKAAQPEGNKAALVSAAEIKVTANSARIVLPVDLETYVTGVLQGEVGILKSPSALQTMAIVARTWALRWRGRHRREGFDFCSLTHCQVFDPSPGPSDRPPDAMARAVQETRGKVLKFHGGLLDVYFSADCGGMTEAARNVWPDRAAPYLPSAKDPYCAGSELSEWQQTISLDAIARVLRESMGVPVHGALLDVNIETRDNSGRARVLRLQGGSSRRVDANEFRYAVNRKLGWNTLKSNLYTLQRHGNALIFTGRGLGHGVGLCQAGAERMGQLGISSEKILAIYFPGSHLAEISPVAGSDPILSSEHFELVFPDSQQPWADETLRSLETARRDLESSVGNLPVKVRIETFALTGDFIRASGLPGWAAASTDGKSILLQPLSTLKRKNILASTLRHELAHLAIHLRHSPRVPRWFEEGMVLFLTGEHIESSSPLHSGGRSLEQCVARPRSEAEMKSAYALALMRVTQLGRERGRAGLWKVLESPTENDLQWLREQK